MAQNRPFLCIFAHIKEEIAAWSGVIVGSSREAPRPNRDEISTPRARGTHPLIVKFPTVRAGAKPLPRAKGFQNPLR